MAYECQSQRHTRITRITFKDSFLTWLLFLFPCVCVCNAGDLFSSLKQKETKKKKKKKYGSHA